ncbi:MAG: hypothetical protein V1708_02430 [Candidatus Micrarchaeota archaeon]
MTKKTVFEPSFGKIISFDEFRLPSPKKTISEPIFPLFSKKSRQLF